MTATQTRTMTSNEQLIREEEEEQMVCQHCNRTAEECNQNSYNPITYWLSSKVGLCCDNCYFEKRDKNEWSDYEDEDEDEVEEEEEQNVDDFEAPNIYPYKKCTKCEERKSCGSYDEDRKWLCEDCCAD